MNRAAIVLRVICVQLIAVALASLVCFVQNTRSAGSFASALFLASVSVWGMGFAMGLSKADYRSKELRDSLMDYLHRIIYNKNRNGSYLGALVEAGKEVEHAELRQSVQRNAKRYLMVGAYADAGIVAGGEAALREEISKQNRGKEEKQTELEEAAQRYATFNMFISTIAPSFLVFAFIGSTLMGQDSQGLFLFSSALLLLLPLLYSIGSLLMWRRLFAG